MDSFPFTVIFIDYPRSGTFRVKSFKTLNEAHTAAKEFAKEHESFSDKILIVRGEVVSFGIGQN